MENPFASDERTSRRDEDVARPAQSFSYSDIAEKLIRDRLWLTALELHTELIEAGREVTKLKEFFSNPVNFESESRIDMLPSLPRSSSQATLDSLDMTRYSEDGDGRGADERVAVLEFELRKAKETISALRASLTLATGNARDELLPEDELKVQPHEARALNFLINEYLLRSGYKLTAITFSDEVDGQDFEDWDDVGLNMARPPELHTLYRAALRGDSKTSPVITTTSTSQTQPLPSVPDLDELKKEISRLEKVNAELSVPPPLTITTSVATQCEEFTLTTATHSDSGSFEQINKAECDGGKSSELREFDEEEVDRSPKLSRPMGKFEKEVWSYLPILKTFDCLESLTEETLLILLGTSIEPIVSALPINTKEWLTRVIPLLVFTAALHPDDSVKEQIVHKLLSMKKRPSSEDRGLILSGLVSLCRHEHNEESLSRLLASCWELMADKYPERRILVGQACAYISPLISEELRSSLLVSILKQLKEDRDDSVRAQALSSLAVISCSILQDKYHEIEELSLNSLLDKSESVIAAALRLFVPVVARWALKTQRLHTSFITNTTHLIDHLITKDEPEWKIVNVLSALTSVLPHLVMFIASSETVLEPLKSTAVPPPQTRTSFSESCSGLSNPVLFFESSSSVGAVIGAFDYSVQKSVPTWPELEWLIETMIPTVLDTLKKVDVTKERTLLSFVRFFTQLSSGFGAAFTCQRVKPIFESRLHEIESALMSLSGDWPSLSLVPVYALGVLSHFNCFEEELTSTLGRLVISLGVTNAPLDSLKLTVSELSKLPKLSNPLLTALWQGVVHQRPSVKLAAARLLAATVPDSSESLISSRIIPALVTLASDPDTIVRVEALAVYVLILERVPAVGKDILDKTYLQIQALISDPSVHSKSSTIIDVAAALARISAVAEPIFLQDVILVELERLTRAGVDLVHSKKTDVAAALVEVFSNLIYLNIPKQALSSTLLPTLRVLEIFCREVLPTHVDTVTGMIRETESRLNPTKSPATSPTNVEDMRQKVTKIFNSPITKPQNLQNLFWKK